jgi:hypothetical protein
MPQAPRARSTLLIREGQTFGLVEESIPADDQSRGGVKQRRLFV